MHGYPLFARGRDRLETSLLRDRLGTLFGYMSPTR